MNEIYELLDKLGIEYIRHKHRAVFTCEEADKYCGDIEGASSKNLFIRNRRGNKHYLLIIESSKKADLKKMAEILDESKLSFASEERLNKYLKLTRGAVSPFGLINDKNKEVTVIVDKDLWKSDRLQYHPNVNTETVELSRDDFKNFLDWCGNEIRFEEI